MASRLLDRQVSLLGYLTSGAAIFGNERDRPLNPALRGIDRGLLRLEARFSHQKRMEKVAGAFPKTFALLGRHHASITRQFAETCPPADISRLANARQFHDFLSARWCRKAPKPPYLRDVAACEMACATVRAELDSEKADEKQTDNRALRRGLRRHPGAVLLRCGYDIRPIFEHDSMRAAPAERETPLAIVGSVDSGEPCIFELAPVVFDLLAALDEWTDPSAFGATLELDDLIHHLSAHGLIEISR
jgi:hypothetical protein